MIPGFVSHFEDDDDEAAAFWNTGKSNLFSEVGSERETTEENKHGGDGGETIRRKQKTGTGGRGSGSARRATQCLRVSSELMRWVWKRPLIASLVSWYSLDRKRAATRLERKEGGGDCKRFMSRLTTMEDCPVSHTE